jgi:hypothetical protein
MNKEVKKPNIPTVKDTSNSPKGRRQTVSRTAQSAAHDSIFKAIIKKTIEFWDQKVFRSPFLAFLFSLCFAVYFQLTDKYSPWMRLLPFLALCVIVLTFIIYFLLHETRSKEYVHFSQILLRIATPALKKYVTFGALVIVPFLVVTYAINKYSKITEIGRDEVKLHTKGKEDLKMRSKPTIDHLAAFNANEFFENVGEFRGYIVSRRTQPKLNPDKLINLLHVYFRSVLLYPSPDMREYYVTGPDRKLYVIQFPGHNTAGEKRPVSLGEMSNTLLADVCSDLLKTAQMAHIIHLIELFTKAIATPILDKSHKFNILNAENAVLKDKFTDAIRMMPENKAKETLDVRKTLVLSELRALNEVEDKKDAENAKKRETLYNVLIHYIRSEIDVLIANNKFIDILKFLYQELEENSNKQVIAALLNNLVIYNNLFLLERKEAIRERVVRYRTLIGEEKYAQLNEMLNFSPEKVELKDFSIEPVEGDKKNIKFEGVDYQKVKTIISFVIHYKSKKDYMKFEYPEKYTVEFITLKNLFDDPIFLFINSMQANISGMPTTIFSDAIGNMDHSTVVRITMQEFFHPDFDLVGNRITYINFEEKEAKLGRKYYAHKDRIVDILRKLHSDHAEQMPLDMKKEDININLISNYLVNYIDENNNSIFHKVHTITNLDSYLKVKKRYLEKITELNLSDEFLGIRELLLKTDIVTPESLREFISRVLDLTVRKSIELRGIYKFLWRDSKLREPLNEPEIQPIIKTHLQPILEAKGIQISREVVAANGSLDFLCTYTHEGSLFKVGIELKKAHHEDLLNGLTQQLPQYLKDEGTRYGIFLVLWFKNDNFRQPGNYNSILDLTKDLEKNIPKEYQFKITVIDCTKGPSPSKM